MEKERAEYKLHATKTYVSIRVLRENKDEIMYAIGGVRGAVETGPNQIAFHVDRVTENPARPRMTRTNRSTLL